MLRYVKTFRAETVISGILISLGLMVTSGWLLHVPMMVEIKSGIVPMVFNTGLCFLLAGTALALMHRNERVVRRLRQGIGIFIVLLCSITFAELLMDRSLGIDLAGLHAWYDYGNTRPGRMAPNTALGFILVGATIWLLHHVTEKWRAVAVVVMSFMILTVGLTGLIGYLVAPDLLFGWARSARMAIHTATGMILCAVTLWLTWSKREWYASQKYFHEDEKIRFLSSSILIVVTMTVGLVGFVLLENSLKKTLENGLEVIVKNRGPWFKTSIDNSALATAATVRLTGFDDASRALLASPQSKIAEEQVFNIGKRLVHEEFRGVALQDASGKFIKTIGQINPEPEVATELNGNSTMALIWDQEMVLRTRIPVMLQDKKIGVIVMDNAIPSLNKALFNVASVGKSGEIGACIDHGVDILCFPGNLHSAPYAVPKRSNHGLPLPIEFALRGQKGVIYTLDYRGKNVLAAYGALAPGLGFVVKEETAEVYSVIRDALAIGTPIIFFVAILGALLLYSQLHPLATKMRESELAAAEKELEMRTIMGAAGDGILTIDEHGLMRSINGAICIMFGYQEEELIGKNISVLIPDEIELDKVHRLDQVLNGLGMRASAKRNLEVNGVRKDEVEFPLELTINEVPITGKRLYVAVMRDITERKEVERKLSQLAQYDSLTGLPNRSLFMDRLNSAALRAKRSSAAIGLMFLDLDGFKEVNDTLGHQTGDELLIQFSRRLSALVRKTDTVARLAGDEFTIVLEELVNPNKDAKAIADKIIDSMQSPFSIAGHDVQVTVSIGLVVHHSQQGSDIDLAGLLKRADSAMYAAKHAGKNAISMA